jgi:hypothetical protein
MWIKGFFASTRNRAAGRLTILLAGALLVAAVLLNAGHAPRAETAAERLQRKLGQSAAGAGKMSGQLPLLVPASEFASVGGDTGQYAFDKFGGFIRPYGDPPYTSQKAVCLRAPVLLPDGSRVHGISAYVYDDDPSLDPDINVSRIELRRAPYHSTAGTQLMASTATTGNGIAEIQKLDAPVTAGEVVDNSLYSYVALVCLDGNEGRGSTLRLYALAIDHGLDVFLPFIVNEG